VIKHEKINENDKKYPGFTLSRGKKYLWDFQRIVFLLFFKQDDCTQAFTLPLFDNIKVIFLSYRSATISSLPASEPETPKYQRPDNLPFTLDDFALADTKSTSTRYSEFLQDKFIIYLS
jgi:hypothetical protein